LVINPSEAFNYQEDNSFWSHEINVISTNDSPLQWVAGAYYFKQHYTQPVYTTNPRQPEWNGPFAFGFLCAQTGGVCPTTTGDFRRFDNRPDVHSESYAVFGQIDWQLNETWKTTLGLRYSHDEKWGSESVRITCFAVPGCDFSALGVPPIIDLTQLGSVVSSGDVLKPGVVGPTTYDPATGFATRRQRQSWEAVTGTAGLEWKPDEDTMLYGKYSKGYKAGGFNIGIFTVLSYFPTTDNEMVDSFEIGLKKNFGSTLQTNMALFHYMYDNLQIPITRVSTGAVPAFGPGPTTATDFYNVPKSISQGFELETTWQPIDNLQILFNYSYNNTEIQEGTAVDSVDPTAIDPEAKPLLTFAQCAVVTAGVTACPVDAYTPTAGVNYTRTQSLEGSALPNAAKNKVALNVNYTWEFEAGSLAGSLSYFWRDKQYGTVFQRWYTEAPDWDQIDARLTWSSADNRYKIIAYGKNLTDNISYDAGAVGNREAGYILSATGATTPQVQGITKSYSVAPPRIYGIELQYKF
jgi:iron complex outermembrane receptor protein